MIRTIVFLEAIGVVAGCEFIGIAILLTFRHRYVDGFVYPWQFSAAHFILGGISLVLIKTFTIFWYLGSVLLTLGLYLSLIGAGLVSLYYFWRVYPARHEPSPCLIKQLALRRRQQSQPRRGEGGRRDRHRHRRGRGRRERDRRGRDRRDRGRQSPRQRDRE